MALTQVKTSGIADDAVTLAKQAGGTDGQIITFDASGNPAAVGPGSDGQVLTSTGAGSPPAFETPAAGVGGATGVDFNDSVKIRLGTGNDLKIFHDGGNSYIQDGGTGSLRFNGTAIQALNTGDNEYMFNCTEDGSVELYYDGTKKVETSSYGVHLGDNCRITLGETAGSPDCHFYGDGTDTNLQNITGDLIIKSNSGGDKAIVVKNGAATELYYDNTKKFETTSAGATVTGGLTLTGGLSMQANQYMHGSSGIDFYGDGSDAASKLVQIVDGNVKFKDGHGIDFSLTANEDSSGSNITGSGTPELLDFYEEGEWDPAPWLWNGSAWVAGSLDAAASTQVGYYTRIGRVCYIGGRVAGFNGDGNFDDKYMAVGPLPFSGAAGDSGGLTGYVKGVATTTTTAFFPSSNYAFSRRIGDMDGSHNAWGGSGTGTATELQLFGFYMIA